MNCSKPFDDPDQICQIPSCIKATHELNRDSTSKTFQLKIYFIGNPKPFFLKVAPTPDSVGWFSRHTTINDTKIKRFTRSLQGFQYELDVYKNVTKPLLDKKISPNFVKNEAVGSNCDVASLVQFVQKSSDNINEEDAKKNVFNAIRFLVLDRSRPKLFDKRTREKKYIEDLKKKSISSLPFSKFYFDKQVKIMFLINEFLENQKTFRDWVILPNILPQNFESVIFQVICALYVCECVGLSHNDLHGGNLYVEEQKTSRNIEFNYAERKFVLRDTKFLVKLYDWDVSVANSIQYINTEATKKNTGLEDFKYLYDSTSGLNNAQREIMNRFNPAGYSSIEALMIQTARNFLNQTQKKGEVFESYTCNPSLFENNQLYEANFQKQFIAENA